MVGCMHSAKRQQREALKLMICQGWKSVHVHQLFMNNVPASTLRNWKAHYLLHGELPCETRVRKMKNGPRSYNRKLTLECKLHLKEIVKTEPHLYLDEIRDKLAEVSGVLFHISTIWKVLVEEVGWTLQKAQFAARERNEIERADHQAMMYNVTEDPKQFIFVDESSKDSDTLLRRRVWQPRNHPFPLSRYFTDHNNNSYTLLGAADIDGFVNEACELVRRKRSADDDDDEAGTIDADRFVQYIEHKLVPVLGNYLLGEARSIVVMDNATIHMDDRVEALITGTGALLIYQSSYSPDLDPIEFCFRQYKCHLKRNKGQYQDTQLAHLAALSSVSSDNMRRYYKKIGCIRNVPDDQPGPHGGNNDVVAERIEDEISDEIVLCSLLTYVNVVLAVCNEF